MNDDAIEKYIRDRFDQNYEHLKEDGGHALSPELRDYALNTVIYYWKKLRDIATCVTETEVMLLLPNKKTPAGRTYSVEGVVDIVKEGNKTIMYDIKTHDPDFVSSVVDEFEEQLNVYAYIWQELRGNQLDETGVIATSFPRKLREAVNSKNLKDIANELTQWKPVIPIPFNQAAVDDTIQKFGKIVDCIEERKFKPLSASELNKAKAPRKIKVATWLCRNCDARYSCASFLEYVKKYGGQSTSGMKRYLQEVLHQEEEEQEQNLNAAIDYLEVI
jgi:hypothetical protein